MREVSQLRGERRDEIARRIEAIHTRVGELQTERYLPAPLANGQLRQVREVRSHAAAARAAAVQALINSANAFGNAADAHDRLASLYERAAASRVCPAEFERRAAFHRAAATADRQQADRAWRLSPALTSLILA